MLADSKRIQEEHVPNNLMIENTKQRSPVSGKMIQVKLQRDKKAVLSKKVEREMKSERKKRKRAEMVQRMEETYLSKEDKIREKLERSRKKKEKRKAEKKVLLLQKEKVIGMKEVNLRREEKKKTKKRKRKQREKLPCSFSPSFSFSSSPLLSSPPSSPLSLSPLSFFPPLPPPVSLCSSHPHAPSPSFKVPFLPVGGQSSFCDQQWIMLSGYCSELGQKQDLDAQTASTSEQKLLTPSDTVGLENFKGQTKSVLSVSQIVTTIGNGKQTVSKPLTTSTLLEGKEKTCPTSAENIPSACGKGGKTSFLAQTNSEMSHSSNNETMTETVNRCQTEVEASKVSHTKGLLKETVDSCSSKKKVASKVAPNKISDQHCTGEHMAQLDVGFNSQCGGQSRLEKEASLKEIEDVLNVREAPCSEKSHQVQM